MTEFGIIFPKIKNSVKNALNPLEYRLLSENITSNPL